MLLLANNDIYFVAIPIGAGMIIALVAILTGYHRKMIRDDMEATLKMEMIERGMSADEIERVLAARLSGRPRFSKTHEREFQHDQRHA